MSCSAKVGTNISGLNGAVVFGSRTKGALGLPSSSGSLSFGESEKTKFPTLRIDFMGRQLVLSDKRVLGDWSRKAPSSFSLRAQASICVSRAMRWWEKTLQPNTLEINSAQELVDSLLNAGDRLVVVDFYSPGCGGCKALHPKICQLAESNPSAIFLKVNYEELRTMCQCLHIHVLPFFRFYRGSEGRLCSFSCTNATIKKFKDAIVKHGVEQCSIGPAKGLDDSELAKLADCGEIPRDLRLPVVTGNMVMMASLEKRAVTRMGTEDKSPLIIV
ncbi:thioredoxin-like 1-2, chloroplastic [Rhodamnia argentea]|uniref:Thioredoxin-like 1-2, chloroplastic n=1 Tax=Rhodamnia argentea TaxID=178133 RepID=A0A8B8NH65_9MYRT|nr:thioredoxin-like 1-2, chloroplastic [Rhodamnia argentea]